MRVLSLATRAVKGSSQDGTGTGHSDGVSLGENRGMGGTSCFKSVSDCMDSTSAQLLAFQLQISATKTKVAEIETYV